MLNLGLRKKSKSQGSGSNVLQNRAPLTRSFSLPNSGRGVATPPESYPHVDCVHETCRGLQDPAGYGNESSFIRIRIGYVFYGVKGEIFVPKFSTTPDGEAEAFVHTLCAFDAGLEGEHMRTDVCPICDRQFFCQEMGKEEAIYLLEVGHYGEGGDGLFETSGARGAIHWACAQDVLDEELLLNIEGESWDEELLHKLSPEE